jgi:hypothetical protein
MTSCGSQESHLYPSLCFATSMANYFRGHFKNVIERVLSSLLIRRNPLVFKVVSGLVPSYPFCIVTVACLAASLNVTSRD